MQNLDNSLNLGEIRPEDWEKIKTLCNCSKTSIRRWKNKGIVKKEYWTAFEKVLNLKPGSMQNYVYKLLQEKGRIKVCKVCNKTYQARLQRTLACSDKCREKLKPKSSLKLDHKILFKKYNLKPEDKEKTRSLIEKEMINFFKSGKEITRFEPEIEYFTFDQLTLEMEMKLD